MIHTCIILSHHAMIDRSSSAHWQLEGGSISIHSLPGSSTKLAFEFCRLVPLPKEISQAAFPCPVPCEVVRRLETHLSVEHWHLKSGTFSGEIQLVWNYCLIDLKCITAWHPRHVCVPFRQAVPKGRRV